MERETAFPEAAGIYFRILDQFFCCEQQLVHRFFHKMILQCGRNKEEKQEGTDKEKKKVKNPELSCSFTFQHENTSIIQARFTLVSNLYPIPHTVAMDQY